jgi:hypothetical protein
MANKWQSTGVYEHPAKHQSGTYGQVTLSEAGIYGLKVGGSHMSCPQDWAAAIHAEETGQTGSMIIRKVPDDVRRAFKSRCAAEGVSQQDKVIELMKQYVGESER